MKHLSIEDPDGSATLPICKSHRTWIVERYKLDAMVALRYFSDEPPLSRQEENGDKKATEHIRKCPKCRDWIYSVIPKDVMQRQSRLARYCCAGMYVAVEEPKNKKSRVSFFLFRGEDPCWTVEGIFPSITYCPWCGKELPNKPFIKQ